MRFLLNSYIQSKATITKQNKEMSAGEADDLYDLLPDSLQRAARKKGAST